MTVFTPLPPTSAGAFTTRPGVVVVDSTYGDLGGSYGAVSPWTYGGQVKGFTPITNGVGTFTPRP